MTKVIRLAAMSLLAGALTTGAQAGESVALTDAQLDGVTAGLSVETGCSVTSGSCSADSTIGGGGDGDEPTVVTDRTRTFSKFFRLTIGSRQISYDVVIEPEE